MKNLTEGNIYKNFIFFAIPLVLAGILSQFYHVIDTVIAGRILGEGALGAIGATADLLLFASAPFWGFSGGFTVYLGNLFGAKDYVRLRSTVFTNVTLMFFGSLLLSILLFLLRHPLFDLLNVDPAIYEEAMIYFTICIFGNFFVVMTNSFIHIMGALGATGFPFVMSILSAVLNIGGNLFSVVVLDLGVMGIAFSTVFSALVVTLCYFVKLSFCFRELGVDGAPIKLDTDSLRISLRYALPNTLQQMVMYFAGMAMSPIVNGIGKAASASYNVTQRIYNISASIYQNSAKTLLNYSAQCVGAGKIDRIKQGWRAGLVQGIFLTLPAIIICAVFASPVCRFFFPADFEGEALDYAIAFARFYLPFVILNLINNLYHAFYRGIGSMGLILSTTFFGSLVRIVAGILLAIPFGMHGVFLGMAISWAAEALLCTVIYKLRYNTTEKIEKHVLDMGIGVRRRDSRKA